MESNLIICTVGTSLLQKKVGVTEGKRKNFPLRDIKGDLAPHHDWKQETIEEKLSEKEHPFNKFLFKPLKELIPKEQLGKRGEKYDPKNNPDLLPAELSSLYLFYWPDGNIPDGEHETNNKDIVVFLPSETNHSLFCACCLRKYIEEKEPLKSKISDVKIIKIEGLQTKDTKKFEEKAILNLSEILKEEIETGHKKDYNVVLNITGGYKGVIPYLTLFGMLYQEGEEDGKEKRISIKYLYEDSKELITLPNLPVAFDIFTWRNYRGFVKAMPHLEAGVAKLFLDDILPAQIGGLFEKDKLENKYRLTTLGETLEKKYNEEKEGELTPYGRGYLLTDKIQDEQKRNALQDCINRWQYLWLGDLIPETVEHARGHTQRVLELAAQILYPILNEEEEENFFGDNDQTDNNLLALISSIWLHDLGHSGDYVECKNEKGTIKDVKPNDDDAEKIQRDIKGFPSQVRYMHHILSWYLISKDKVELFDNSAFDDDLIEDIRRIGLYHRGKMPVLEKPDPDNPELKNYKPYKHIGIEISEPLEKLRSNNVNLPLLGALLRIADGGDVQEERTISENYTAMRFLQNKREIEKLKQEEEKLRKNVDALFDASLSSQLPEHLAELKNFAREYFSKDSTEWDNQYKEITDMVGECVRKYIGGEGLECIEGVRKIILRNWLSTLDQYVFKKSPGPHFEKHAGIRAVMYLLDKPIEENVKKEYHYKVLVIHKEEKEGKKPKELIENAKRVLEAISEEYTKVKKILNEHHIYFDYYEGMDEKTGEITVQGKAGNIICVPSSP